MLIWDPKLGLNPAYILWGHNVQSMLEGVGRLASSRGRASLALHLPWKPAASVAMERGDLCLGIKDWHSLVSDQHNIYPIELSIGGVQVDAYLSITVSSRFVMLTLRAADSRAVDVFWDDSLGSNKVASKMAPHVEFVSFDTEQGTWQPLYPKDARYEIAWSKSDLRDYELPRTGFDEALDLDRFGSLLFAMLDLDVASPTPNRIAKRALEASKPCRRTPLAPYTGRVEQEHWGTWVGMQTYDHCLPIAPCRQCGDELDFVVQVDASQIGCKDGLWFLYLCAACLDTQFPRMDLGCHALVFVKAPSGHKSLVRAPLSPLLSGRFGLNGGDKGLSFPGIEEFFETFFWASDDGCPSEARESIYRECVEELDSRAELSSDGCYFGEKRVAQMGGYIELTCNSSPFWCELCGSNLNAVSLAIPNATRSSGELVFAPWLSSCVLQFEACYRHPQKYRLWTGVMKYG